MRHAASTRKHGHSTAPQCLQVFTSVSSIEDSMRDRITCSISRAVVMPLLDAAGVPEAILAKFMGVLQWVFRHPSTPLKTCGAAETGFGEIQTKASPDVRGFVGCRIRALPCVLLSGKAVT